jgi:hypothetical protein
VVRGPPPGGGRPPTGGPLQQRRADHALELLDAAAEGRLRQVEALGRLAEAAGLHHGQKTAKIQNLEIDAHHASIATIFAFQKPSDDR